MSHLLPDLLAVGRFQGLTSPPRLRLSTFDFPIISGHITYRGQAANSGLYKEEPYETPEKTETLFLRTGVDLAFHPIQLWRKVSSGTGTRSGMA